MFRLRYQLPALLLLLLSITVVSVRAQSPEYTVTDLGPFIHPNAINDSGQIVGAYINGRLDAILYSDGVLKTITPPNGATAQAWGINNFGDVVGEVLFCDMVNGNCVNSYTRAFIYSSRKNTYTILGTLGGRDSRAYDINDAGQVTGYSDIASANSTKHAFIYKDGVFSDIGAPLSAAETHAFTINANGQVAGFASSNTSARGAFLYDSGVFLFFEQQGGADDLNDLGEVVGSRGGNDDGSGNAFLYSHGAIQDLGKLNGGSYARAFAINNSSQTVGVAGPSFFSSEGHKAFIHSGGVMQDLNLLVPPVTGRILTAATNLNDAGQIVTNGQLNGEDHGFVLTPTQPMLLTQPNTNQAIAVQSVMFLRDPFTTITARNLSNDTRTRLTILTHNLEIIAGENIAPPTVQAEDSLQRLTSLPVEYVGKVPGAGWLTQIVVRLPDALDGVGALQLTVSFRGRISNKGTVTIAFANETVPKQ